MSVETLQEDHQHTLTAELLDVTPDERLVPAVAQIAELPERVVVAVLVPAYVDPTASERIDDSPFLLDERLRRIPGQIARYLVEVATFGEPLALMEKGRKSTFDGVPQDDGDLRLPAKRARDSGGGIGFVEIARACLGEDGLTRIALNERLIALEIQEVQVPREKTRLLGRREKSVRVEGEIVRERTRTTLLTAWDDQVRKDRAHR
jgi:hypothetical protein